MDLAVLFDSIDEEIVVGADGLMTDDSEDGLIGLVENFLFNLPLEEYVFDQTC